MTVSPLPTSETQSLYDADYLDWIENTLQQLKSQDYSRVDWENLLEEIGDMSRRVKDGFESHLTIVMMHLLKWQYQPERRSRSWTGSIVEHRRRLRKSIKHSPSLKLYLENVFAEAYIDAVEQAAAETGLPSSTFPNECPYTIAQTLDSDFMPE